MIYKIVNIIIKMNKFDSNAKLPPMTINKIMKEPERKEQERKEPVKEPKIHKKCQLKGCKKKLSVTALGCRCQKRFCKIHFSAENHNCTFDYKSFLRRNLENTVVGDKIHDRL